MHILDKLQATGGARSHIFLLSDATKMSGGGRLGVLLLPDSRMQAGITQPPT